LWVSLRLTLQGGASTGSGKIEPNRFAIANSVAEAAGQLSSNRHTNTAIYMLKMPMEHNQNETHSFVEWLQKSRGTEGPRAPASNTASEIEQHLAKLESMRKTCASNFISHLDHATNQVISLIPKDAHEKRRAFLKQLGNDSAPIRSYADGTATITDRVFHESYRTIFRSLNETLRAVPSGLLSSNSSQEINNARYAIQQLPESHGSFVSYALEKAEIVLQQAMSTASKIR